MKIKIGDETFDYDHTSRPLSEALAIEKAWGRRYAEWEQEAASGSAEAAAVLVWVILRREGRDVPLEDILEGKFDFDYAEMQRSILQAAAEAQAAEEDPTSGAEPLTAPDGTDTTSPATKGSSRKSSTSPRGTSES